MRKSSPQLTSLSQMSVKIQIRNLLASLQIRQHQTVKKLRHHLKPSHQIPIIRINKRRSFYGKVS